MKSASYSPLSAYTRDRRARSSWLTFCTVTPICRTSAGSRPSAWLTRFCTSTAAMSGSRVTSNVTVIWLTPLLVLDEDM